MRTKLSKIAQVAAFGLALALTFSCSSDDGGVGGSGRGGNGSSSSGDGGSSPSVGSGKCGQFVGIWIDDRILGSANYTLIITDTDDWKIGGISSFGSSNGERKSYTYYNGTAACNGNTAKLKITKKETSLPFVKANVGATWTATISNNKITLDANDGSVEQGSDSNLPKSYSKYEFNDCKMNGKQLYCQYQGNYYNDDSCHKITDETPNGYVKRSCEEIATSCNNLDGTLYVGVEASEIAWLPACKTSGADYVCSWQVYTPESGLIGSPDRTERKNKCSENGGLRQCDKNSLDESSFYNEKTQGCCGNTVYDKSTQGCCDNTTVYDKSIRGCVNGIITSNKNFCDYGGSGGCWRMPTNDMCAGGTLVFECD